MGVFKVNRKIKLSILAGVTACLAVFTFTYTVQHKNVNESNSAQLARLKANTADLTQRAKKLTTIQIKSDLAHSKFNLDDAKKQANDKISKNFQIAYSNMDDKRYREVKGNFVKQLGASFGEQLAQVTSPKGGNVYSHNIEKMTVGFGKYDTENHVIPVMIVVDYKVTDQSPVASHDQLETVYNTKTHSFGATKHTLGVQDK